VTRGSVLVALLLLAAACARDDGTDELRETGFVAGRVGALQTEAPLFPGPQPGLRLVPIRNPLEGDEAARARGEQLWTWMNCAGCHGSVGGGGISHPIRHGNFIYGMDVANIFLSILQGRPNGMPAFGGMLTEQQIWELVLHVQAIGRGEVEADWQEPTIRVAEREPGMLEARR
jgi:cytochrome c oxidase cbb3-type subunit III